MWQRNQTSLGDFIFERLFDDSLTHLFLFSLTMVLFLIAVSGNALTILLICADPRLHTPMYFLLSHPSLVDLMLVSTTIPKMATNYLSGKKSISFVGCATQHFLYLSVGGAECLILALMSYDRYVAICHPLHYSALMKRKVGLMMAVMSWLGASINSLIYTVMLMQLPFCGPQCSSAASYFSSSPSCWFLHPMPSSSTASFRCVAAGSKRNAFATCSSHLTVVSLWFGACMFSYMRPRSQCTPLQDKVGSVFYSIITPTMNPLIYTLRNKDVAKALRRVLGRDVITQRQQLELP
uniref:G-protein coupled receptors family 1 profile domain-containing protein n=1 Tax=Equus asinus TaxID=9793 RepID=A0A9L0J3K7_EQUAS